MYNKNQAKKKLNSLPRSIFDGLDRDDSNKEILEKMKDKKLPEYVKTQIDKEMKRQGGDSQKAVSQKYI